MQYPTTYEQALAYESHAAQLVKKNMENSALPRSAETLAVLKEIQALVVPGRYRHFKGGEYTVIRVLERVNSGLCDVEYYSHYGAYEGEPATRELVGPDSFLRPVDRPEYKGVRFLKIDDEATQI